MYLVKYLISRITFKSLQFNINKILLKTEKSLKDISPKI